MGCRPDALAHGVVANITGEELSGQPDRLPVLRSPKVDYAVDLYLTGQEGPRPNKVRPHAFRSIDQVTMSLDDDALLRAAQVHDREGIHRRPPTAHRVPDHR